jgi:hypothetical protein
MVAPVAPQSGRMALRMEARRIGLAMQLAPQEWPHWLAGAAQPVCAVPRPRRGNKPACWSYWQKSPGVWVNQWQEVCEDRLLLNHFEKLPDNVYKVEADTDDRPVLGREGRSQVCRISMPPSKLWPEPIHGTATVPADAIKSPTTSSGGLARQAGIRCGLISLGVRQKRSLFS